MKRLLTFDQLNELSNWNQVKFIIDLMWNDIKKLVNEESYIENHFDSSTMISFTYSKDGLTQEQIDDKLKKIEKITKKYYNSLLHLNIILSKLRTFNYNNTITIYIKNLHTKRVKPKKYIYHCSDRKNRNSILKDGLIPKQHSESKYKNQQSLVYPPSIFTTNRGLDSVWNTDSDTDLWEINTENLPNKWWYDLNLYKNSVDATKYIMTFEPIPPEFIKHIYTY